MPLPVRWIILIAGLSITVYSCKDQPEQSAPRNADVTAVAVGKEDLKMYDEYVGQIYGQSDIQIQPRVEGWITGIFFKEGQLVQKGQLLYTIDDAPQQNLIAASAADLAKAETWVANKKSELDRIKPLAEIQALSQRDLDAAQAGYDAAVSEAKAAQAKLNNAKIELGYTHVFSPITGIIGISKALVGDYVPKTALGNGINTVSSVEDVRVRFPISESEYLRFAKRIQADPKSTRFADIPVDLILADKSIYPEKGRIDLTNRQIDPATGSLLVQAVFSNQMRMLRPGQYAKVRFQTDVFKDAVIVPQQAVNQMQDLYQVFVLTDSNSIRPTVVKVGKRVGSNWIISEGLKPGEKVVMVGSAYISPKIKVNPVLMPWNYDSTSMN